VSEVCCKRYGAADHMKNGIVRDVQRYLCRSFGCNFTMTPPRGKPPAMKALAMLLYAVGNVSFCSIARILGVSEKLWLWRTCDPEETIMPRVSSVLLCTSALELIGLASSSSAHATILLSLIDPPMQTSTVDLTFTATSTFTTLSVAGYNLPAFEFALDNSVTLAGGGPNLLSQTWAFTPAASGTDAGQSNDGASVNDLSFGGVTAGSYDTFSQTFTTTPGSSYVYTFDFIAVGSGPSGFMVSENVASGVPEASTWAMTLVGIAGLGFAAHRRATRKGGVAFFAA
jgi:hypothetical protein